MRVEVIRPDGDTKREIWHFSLCIDIGGRDHIYFDRYSFQTKGSTRHRIWKTQRVWDRLDHRGSDIEAAPLPKDVETEVRSKLSEFVATLPIKF
jgi:hypothetical protein